MEDFEIFESLDNWILTYRKIYLVSLESINQLDFVKENQIPDINLQQNSQKFKCPNFERLLEVNPISTITKFYFSNVPKSKSDKKKYRILFIYFLNLIKTLQIDIIFLFEDNCDFWKVKPSYLKIFFEILSPIIIQNKILLNRIKVSTKKLISTKFRWKAKIFENILKTNNSLKNESNKNKNKSEKIILNNDSIKIKENNEKVGIEIQNIQNIIIEKGNLEINVEIMNKEAKPSEPQIDLDSWLVSYSNHYSVSLESQKHQDFLESQPLIDSLFPSQNKSQPNCPNFLLIFSQNPIETLKTIIDSSLFCLIKLSLNPACKKLLQYFRYLIDLHKIDLNLIEAFQFDKLIWRDVHENFFKDFIKNLKLDVRRIDIKAYIAELWVNGKQDRALIIARQYKLLYFLDKTFRIKDSLTPDFSEYLEKEIQIKNDKKKNAGKKNFNQKKVNEVKKVEAKDNKIAKEEIKVQVEEKKTQIEENKTQVEENKVKVDENTTHISEHKIETEENKLPVETKEIKNKENENKALIDKKAKKKEARKQKKEENKKVLTEEEIKQENENNLNTSLNYHIYQDDICIYQLIEIFHKDLKILALITEKLSSGYPNRNSKHYWKFTISSFLVLRFPDMPIKNNLKSKLKPIVPRSCQGLSREFGPLDPIKELSIRIPESEVYFINSLEHLSSIYLSGNFIGLDSEWRSNIFKFCDNPVSILQIATFDQVYIIDLLALGNEPTLNEFLLQIFESDSIKLGVSFEDDLKKIYSHYPCLDACSRKMNKYVDVVDAYKRVFKESPGGLAGVCEKVLGKCLSKYEQRSNWENRPLRRSQMHYAALDAHVQIEAFQVILSKADEEFEEFFKPFEGDVKPGEKKKKSKRCKICFRDDHLTEKCLF